jgi:tetratricopeptide (TPR) repeat protein
MEGAFEHFRLAVQYFDQPDAVVWNDFAWMLAVMPQSSFHNPDEAVRFAQKACELSSYNDAGFLDTLAVAYAQEGNFDDAAKTTDKVIQIAKAKGRPALVSEMERRRRLYLKHLPYWPETITEERPVKSMLDLSPRK